MLISHKEEGMDIMGDLLCVSVFVVIMWVFIGS
jgi:hypothetical protein